MYDKELQNLGLCSELCSFSRKGSLSCHDKDASLKLRTIHKCFFYVPIKGRFQCYAALRCDEYGHFRTWHNYNADKTL